MQILITVADMAESVNIKIDNQKGLFIVNGNPKQIDIDNFVMRFQAIVASWPSIMIDNSVLDGGWYEVKIRVDNDVRKFKGKNAFPTNYYEFIQLIDEVCE